MGIIILLFNMRNIADYRITVMNMDTLITETAHESSFASLPYSALTLDIHAPSVGEYIHLLHITPFLITPTILANHSSGPE